MWRLLRTIPGLHYYGGLQQCVRYKCHGANDQRCVHSWRNSHVLRSENNATLHTSPGGPSGCSAGRTVFSEETVHAFDGFASVVQTLGTDALTAGVVEPTILRSSH